MSFEKHVSSWVSNLGPQTHLMILLLRQSGNNYSANGSEIASLRQPSANRSANRSFLGGLLPLESAYLDPNRNG
jgi:hypothetical protein